MGWDDILLRRDDSQEDIISCDCGAKVKIYMDDGTPGCRDRETARCPICKKELASHFGTCDAYLISEPKKN